MFSCNSFESVPLLRPQQEKQVHHREPFDKCALKVQQDLRKSVVSGLWDNL